ncbi:CPBP family intramembrane metalloprotease [Parablautia intestinalis]|uniref:CPBP family intramembrane metalloprotease n=1 Tax=Parablautia intestinalis TaxID=2320100 RepID=A0A3A9APJ6_9FIRM|nr:CPBP family intramembrane metalloprotease [Parablautia intestinalis]
MLPVALAFLLNFVSVFIPVFIFIIREMLVKGGAGSFQDILNAALIWCYDNLLLCTAIYHIIEIVVFGIWYYLAYGRKKREAYFERPGISQVGFIVLLGAALQVLTASGLNFVYYVCPGLLQGYEELMETSGLSEFTLLSFAVTVILAPLGEEFLFRGIVFRLAGKVSGCFFVANLIQAFAFGVFHANVVQGIYAFGMGLALGYIYGKYHNIWICVLLHSVINSSSFLVKCYFAVFPETFCKGLFNQVHRKFTFQGKKIRPGTCF